jgi:hypothetical protein
VPPINLSNDQHSGSARPGTEPGRTIPTAQASTSPDGAAPGPHDDVMSSVDGGPRSVAPARVTMRELRRARNLRRLVLVFLAAFLVLGALNFFGGRRAHAEATGDGYQLQVSYPMTGRPGIGAPIQIQVQHSGGFTDPITLAMSSDYLDLFSVQSIDPQPSQETTTQNTVIWQFDQPPGDTLTISFDSQFQAEEHPGTHAAAVSILRDGQPSAQVRLRTWEAP